MHGSLQPLAGTTPKPDLLTAAPASTISAGYVMEVLAGLILILIVIALFAWMARRFPQLGGRGRPGMRILAVLPLGTREKAVLVQVGNEQLLLGVTPTSINMLHRPGEPVDIDVAKQTPVFAGLLARFNKPDST